MIKGVQLPCLGVCKGVQNRGCRLIVHTCRFKVSPKNDGFSSNFRDFSSHYYNGLILKSGYLSLETKKCLHTPFGVSDMNYHYGGSEETRTPVHIETHNDQLQLSLLDKKYSV